MKKEMIFSVIRHTLTFVGGLLVIKGTIDQDTMEQVVSGVLTLTGLIWGIVDKK